MMVYKQTFTSLPRTHAAERCRSRSRSSNPY